MILKGVSVMKVILRLQVHDCFFIMVHYIYRVNEEGFLRELLECSSRYSFKFRITDNDI